VQNENKIKMIKKIILNLFFIKFTISNAFSVCIGVGCYCNVNVNPLNFGNYNPFVANQIDANGNITVTCGASLVGAVIAYQVNINPGNAGNFNPRYMTNGAYHMNYNIYTDAAHNLIFGDGTSSTNFIQNNYTLILATQRITDHPFYARLIGGQTNVARGNYADNLTVTVVY
jgi:spore coat protein U-like protein